MDQYNITVTAELLNFLTVCIDTHVRAKGIVVAQTAVAATQMIKQAKLITQEPITKD